MPSIDRRTFLKVGALAGAGVAAGTLLVRRFVPEQVRVAIIGARGHGTVLAQAFAARPDTTVAAVCDADRAVAARLVNRLGLTITPEVDLRRILDRNDIDAVAIATPHHWHALATVWALDAGKHVYVEKPMTHTIGEGAAILAAAKRSGRVVQVGTQRRSHPALREAIAALHDGAIGSLQRVECFSGKRRKSIGPPTSGQIPPTLNANLWFGPRALSQPTRERFHYDWHWFWDFGNGGLGNNGIHRLDVARWGARLDGFGDRITTIGGRFGPRDAGETPNTQLSIHRFADLVITHDLRGLKGRPLPPGFEPRDEVHFVGEGGTIVTTVNSARLLDEAGTVVKRWDADGNSIDLHVANFLTAVRDSEQVRVPPAEGQGSAGLVHVAGDAHRRARPVDDRGLDDFLDPLDARSRELAEQLRRSVRAVGDDAAFVAASFDVTDHGLEGAEPGVTSGAYRAPFTAPGLGA